MRFGLLPGLGCPDALYQKVVCGTLLRACKPAPGNRVVGLKVQNSAQAVLSLEWVVNDPAQSL